MESELTPVVPRGASTVVGLMATDAWNAVRPRVVALLRQGDRAQEDALRIEHELELERREVVAARDSGDMAAVADIEAVWRTRLRRLLHDSPSTETALDKLIAETCSGSDFMRNTISGAGSHRPVTRRATWAEICT
ncbi:hypothetical protein OH768_47050 [Streptomyces sp. NBC_01622]|uniref:hypothetical protein n=1 Tax=Streptomyces sp. NBC_01622 TaxID=2975903 RepID=UPI00386B5F52|nr:hypothetical protein OH768_47050 [Streptomyces sp. NBC_01622]